jgi:hypothetical protein
MGFQKGVPMKLLSASSAALVLFALFASVVCAPAKDEKISVDQLLKKHLQSIGKTTEPTTATRVLQGKVVFSEIIGRNVRLEGASSVLSQGRKFKCSFQFGLPQYQGEQFVFDGQKSMVGMIDPTSRSNLGTFLYSQEEVLREGLFGGTLSTGWPLLRLAQSGAKLEYEGVRKIEGRELHDVIYVPKKRGGNGELLIHLYFEPETYRHVMTVYSLTLHNSAGNAEEGTDETKQTLEERFDDFRGTDGLTLPWYWTVRYHVTPQSKTQEFQWENNFQSLKVLTSN